jgi:hypothetical protein
MAMTEHNATNPYGADRRAAVRYPCSPESSSGDDPCQPISTRRSEVWSAAVRDLSTGGVGIVVNRRFEPGTLLSVELQDAAQTLSRILLVRVVRALRESNDRWLLGCAFTSKLTEGELLALI